MKKNNITEALQKAGAGLLYPSETDAEFEAFIWEGAEGKPDKARVLELAGLPASTPITAKGLDAFFAAVTEEQSWHNKEEKEEVARFRQLVQAIKDNLSDVKVFLTGKRPERGVYIVGRVADDGWAGLATKIVET